MKIINAEKYKNTFTDYLKKINQTFIHNIFDIQQLITLNDYDGFYLIVENKKIIDFFRIYKDEFNFIIPNFSVYEKQLQELSFLKETYPEYILETNNYFLNPEQKEYFECKFNSSINNNYVYIKDLNNYYVTKKEYVYILRDNFEKEYFENNLDYSDIVFADINCMQLKKLFNTTKIFNIPQWTNNNGINIAGFHYLSLENEDEDARYLLCLCNNNILGAIKYNVYTQFEHTFQCIDYIDVNFYYRQLGIAKLLANQMNAHLIKGLPLVITEETEMGQKCHVHEIFRKYIQKDFLTYNEMKDLQYEKHIKDLEKINKTR